MAANNSTEHEEPQGLQQPQDPTVLLFQAPDFSSIPARPRKAQQDTNDDGPAEQNEQKKSSRRDRNKTKNRGRGNRNQQNSDDHDEQLVTEETHKTGSNGDKKSAADKKPGRGDATEVSENSAESQTDGEDQQHTEASELEIGPIAKRRRKRRRGTTDIDLEGGSEEDPENTVTRVRAPRATTGNGPDEVTSVRGSTRLEAKRQRRRQSRRTRRRPGIITEAEFLARRESVERKMMVLQREHRIQIAVMEDGVLAEHFVSNTQQDSLIGNIYLGKVQNVLPSMEAAFVDIGRGRNAVLYAGEVNWDAAQLDGQGKKIENALKAGDSVLVQVTKDPVDHKGARLTGQISLPGRYLVYVPGGSMTGISRKLPENERARLKKILKEYLPENTGVIVRTAAEGTSEQELMNDINRLRAQWEEIQETAAAGKTLAPEQLHSEPDLTVKVVRDVFNEDFTSMVVQGDEVWDNIEAYVTYVAPDLRERLSKWEPADHDDTDLFAHHRLDEQLNKALQRKVNLPSGGSLVFDRTEAMTVVDVNTGKFTGSGGNLEETVTKNNLEAAEEIVRQLRLRDIGGIIVIDFIDMVLESNRDLVVRRLVECLGRDRSKHQVAEVTSLGLVQMTRKRMGTGLVEVFSETCECCNGRGIVVYETPVDKAKSYDSHGNERRRGGEAGTRRSRRRRNQHDNRQESPNVAEQEEPQEDPKAEQNRQAMNKIAAALHKPEEQPAKDHQANDQAAEDSSAETQRPKADTEQGDQEGSGQTRSSAGRRSRSARRRRNRNRAREEQQAKQQDPTPAEPQQEAAQSETENVARKPRRRAASSETGAESIEQVDTTQASGSSFTASASSRKQQSTASTSGAPTILGVGVSADQISSPGTD